VRSPPAPPAGYCTRQKVSGHHTDWATLLRLVTILRRGWITILVAWLRQVPLTLGASLPEPYVDRGIRRRHKFKYDRLYIKHQSVWLDLKLIALLGWITCHGRWEQRGHKW
jgi:hypothetical protein